MGDENIRIHDSGHAHRRQHSCQGQNSTTPTTSPHNGIHQPIERAPILPPHNVNVSLFFRHVLAIHVHHSPSPAIWHVPQSRRVSRSHLERRKVSPSSRYTPTHMQIFPSIFVRTIAGAIADLIVRFNVVNVMSYFSAAI